MAEGSHVSTSPARPVEVRRAAVPAVGEVLAAVEIVAVAVPMKTTALVGEVTLAASVLVEVAVVVSVMAEVAAVAAASLKMTTVAAAVAAEPATTTAGFGTGGTGSNDDQCDE